MRIIFFGTGSFAVPALERLAAHVSLVVTQPDRPSGRHLKPKPSAVKAAANALGLAVESPERSRLPQFVQRLNDEHADVLVVASYGQILSEAVLNSATRGGINLHGSLLPAYRGAAPIQRAIQHGESETGVTLMQMERGMDTGDIIDVVRTPIHPDETYGELQDRVAVLAAELAERWLPKIVAGGYPRRPQDSTLATLAPKVERSETEIDLTGSAKFEYDRFRAFSPTPGAFLATRAGRLKLNRLRRSDASGTPGTLVTLNPEVVVACGEGALCLIEVQPEGKRSMEGRAWLNGVRLRIGDNLMS